MADGCPLLFLSPYVHIWDDVSFYPSPYVQILWGLLFLSPYVHMLGRCLLLSFPWCSNLMRSSLSPYVLQGCRSAFIFLADPDFFLNVNSYPVLQKQWCDFKQFWIEFIYIYFFFKLNYNFYNFHNFHAFFLLKFSFLDQDPVGKLNANPYRSRSTALMFISQDEVSLYRSPYILNTIM